MTARGKLHALLQAGLRIGLTGAASAGKTTFAGYLCDGAPELLHDEGVRDWLAKEGVIRFSEIDAERFCALHLHLLDRYRASKARVFDRTPADLFFYASDGPNEFLDLPTLETECRALQQSLDLLVVFPFHLPYFVSDFAREDDKVEHMRAAGLVLDIIKRWGLCDNVVIYDHQASAAENAARITHALANLHRQSADRS